MENTLDSRWRFLAGYANALQKDGNPAQTVESALMERARCMGIPLRVMSAPTLILLSIGPEDAPWTVLLPAELGNLDLHRHERIERLADRVCAGELDAARALRRLRNTPQPLYGPGTQALASLVLSAAAAPFFGGGAQSMLAAGLGSAAVTLVMSLSLFKEVRTPVAAGLGTLAAIAAADHLGGDPTASLLGALILLLPGFTATVATTELATGNLISGMSRAAAALSTLIQIGLGMAVATHLWGPSHTVSIEDPVPMLAAIVATALSFTVVLGARARMVGWISASVAVAWAGSSLGLAWFGPHAGIAFAAWLVGMTGVAWNHISGKPAWMMVVPGLLLLVPGATGFRGVVSALAGDVVLGIDLLLQMGVTAFAIAIGLLAARTGR